MLSSDANDRVNHKLSGNMLDLQLEIQEAASKKDDKNLIEGLDMGSGADNTGSTNTAVNTSVENGHTAQEETKESLIIIEDQ